MKSQEPISREGGRLLHFLDIARWSSGSSPGSRPGGRRFDPVPRHKDNFGIEPQSRLMRNSVGRLFLFNHNSLIMKQKIKEALRQEYKSRLELDDDRLDGVAAFASTFVTDESKIEEFVKNEATLAMLKSYQSVLDKDRAKRNKPEPTPKPSDNGNQPPEPNPESEKIDIEAIINAAVAKQKAESDKTIEALASRITEFESKQAAKDVMMSFQENLSKDSYVNGFPKQKANALKFLMRDYERGGNAMTEKELQDGFSEYFNAFVDSKGNDGHRPFRSDGASGGEAELDMTEVMKIYQKSGRVQGKE